MTGLLAVLTVVAVIAVAGVAMGFVAARNENGSTSRRRRTALGQELQHHRVRIDTVRRAARDAIALLGDSGSPHEQEILTLADELYGECEDLDNELERIAPTTGDVRQLGLERLVRNVDRLESAGTQLTELARQAHGLVAAPDLGRAGDIERRSLALADALRDLHADDLAMASVEEVIESNAAPVDETDVTWEPSVAEALDERSDPEADPA